MGDQDDRDALVPLDLTEHIEYLCLNGRVERCRRFVCDEYARPGSAMGTDLPAMENADGEQDAFCNQSILTDFQ